MRRLVSAEVDEARATPGRAILLFLTDRCPVGCAHCSVDSRADSPTISNFPLFEQVVEALCAHSADVVGISGGEPFIERRGLSYASAAVAAVGKSLVVYTSGVWATSNDIPRWIRGVLSRCACVVLSTDAFHQNTVYEERFIQAARHISREGIWVIVQALDIDDTLARTDEMLQRAFGGSYDEHAEIRPITPLPYGRGADVFTYVHRERGDSFGRCNALAAPVIRYDGRLTACCNELVIMGGGPRVLQGRATDAFGAEEVLRGFCEHPHLKVIGSLGPGVLTALPEFADMADREFPSICQLCWEMLGRGNRESVSILRALPVLSAKGVTT